MNSQNPIDDLDQATSQRLAKLRTMPVDTSRLDRIIQARIPRPEPDLSRWSFMVHSRLLRTMAAGIATLAVIGVVLWSLSGGAVLASPDMMARFHEELLEGKVSAVQVDTIADANRALAEQWNHAVEIPDVPADHVMMCCMRYIKNKRVACVLLKNDGVPVTMAVANATDMKMPDSQTLTRGEITYHVQSSGKLNMVTARHDGRWICLIAALPVQRLIELGNAIQL